MSREALLKALGQPDGDSTPDWFKWKQKRIECTFYPGATGICEIRFNAGFPGALANGLKLGGPADQVQKLYGKPSFTMRRSNGAKEFEYSDKGILFWTYRGKITQIVVFKSYVPTKEAKRASGNAFIETQTREAKAGNYWAKYRLWAAYQEGAIGVPKDPEQAKQWLGQLVEGAYLATFRPTNGFNPHTPGEFLAEFGKHSNLMSEPKSVGGASFFRTRAENGVLIGSFITAYPEKMRKAIGDNPSLKLISIEKLTPEMFVRYVASPQESLDAEEKGELDTARAREPAAGGKTTELKYDDGKPDGKRSYGDSGEMIRFTLLGDAGKLAGIRIHGSRYGLPQPPREDFLIYVLSSDMSQILFTEKAPYKLFQRGREKWVNVNFKSVHEVPKTFWIVLDFKAHQTKGVCVSYDTSTGGNHSKIGLPGENKPRDVDFGGDWMIRAVLAAEP